MPRRKRRSRAEVLLRDDQGRKQCITCGEWKPEEDYTNNSKHSDGLHGECRCCWNERNKRAREARGGWSSPLEQRLFEEDPWLYQCYTMLANAEGIRVVEQTARRLYNDVLPKDRKCDCCQREMVTTVGQAVGAGPGANKRRPDSPSLEHVLLRGMDGYADWENLKIICWECNDTLKNTTPEKLYQVADWRHKQWKQRGIDKHGNTSVRPRSRQPAAISDKGTLSDDSSPRFQQLGLYTLH
jgi:hypothetical protein